MAERIESLLFSLRSFYSLHPDTVTVTCVCQGVPTFAEKIRSSKLARVIEVSHSVFNKGWCVNVGVRRTTAPYFVIAESDMWAATPYLHNIPTWMKEQRVPWCFAWDQLYYSTDEEKQLIMARQAINTSPNRFVVPKRAYSEGGFVAFERAFFDKIGWCSEWFEELGGPDNELAERARYSSGKYLAYPMQVIHLWHPKVRCRERPTRARNIDILLYTRRKPGMTIKTLHSVKPGGAKPYCTVKSFFQAREAL